jgi:hypothetical protein
MLHQPLYAVGGTSILQADAFEHLGMRWRLAQQQQHEEPHHFAANKKRFVFKEAEQAY